MNQQQTIKNIIEINRRVCFNLWNIANVNSSLSGLSPRLILPQKRSGEIRISEQESRVLYCAILNTLNYFNNWFNWFSNWFSMGHTVQSTVQSTVQ